MIEEVHTFIGAVHMAFKWGWVLEGGGVCLALLTSVSRALAHVRCLVPRANKGNNVSGGRTATIKEVQKDKVFFVGWGGSQQK